MLDKSDKKELKQMMVEVVGGALEDVVLPRFDSIEKRLDIIEEDVDTLKDTTTRIELKLNSVVKTQDSHSDQIAKINKVLKLETKRA